MAEDMYDDLFEGVKTRTVELELLEETYQQALQLAESNGWPPREALLTIFAHGLAHLRADALEASENNVDEDALQRRLMRLDGMYAVMKFRAFTLTEENQRMRMALAAYETEYGGMKRLVDRLRAELEEAKRIRSSETTETERPQEAPALSSTNPSTGVLRALRGRLSRR